MNVVEIFVARDIRYYHYQLSVVVVRFQSLIRKSNLRISHFPVVLHFQRNNRTFVKICETTHVLALLDISQIGIDPSLREGLMYQNILVLRGFWEGVAGLVCA